VHNAGVDHAGDGVPHQGMVSLMHGLRVRIHLSYPVYSVRHAHSGNVKEMPTLSPRGRGTDFVSVNQPTHPIRSVRHVHDGNEGNPHHGKEAVRADHGQPDDGEVFLGLVFQGCLHLFLRCCLKYPLESRPRQLNVPAQHACDATCLEKTAPCH